MTRGRCGSLRLHRMALSSTTPYRSARRSRDVVSMLFKIGRFGYYGIGKWLQTLNAITDAKYRHDRRRADRIWKISFFVKDTSSQRLCQQRNSVPLHRSMKTEASPTVWIRLDGTKSCQEDGEENQKKNTLKKGWAKKAERRKQQIQTARIKTFL